MSTTSDLYKRVLECSDKELSLFSESAPHLTTLRLIDTQTTDAGLMKVAMDYPRITIDGLAQWDT